MARRRKKYGWLYHEEHDAWMPADGAYLAEKEGRLWLLWRCRTPYKPGHAELVSGNCSTLEDAVYVSDKDREAA